MRENAIWGEHLDADAIIIVQKSTQSANLDEAGVPSVLEVETAPSPRTTPPDKTDE